MAIAKLVISLLYFSVVNGFGLPRCLTETRKFASQAVGSALVAGSIFLNPLLSNADDGGASLAANSKIAKGGASTLQSGRTISITR